MKITLQSKIKIHSTGFTLIEIIIYCAIFVTFAVVAIESMIWISSQLSVQDKRSEIEDQNIYKIYFSNIYKRYKIKSQKIEDDYNYLIASSSVAYPVIKEDTESGVVLDKHEVMYFNRNKRELQDILFFDSVDNGV